MRRQLIVTEDTEADLLEAAAWYEKQRRGMARTFLEQVQRTFDLIAKSPLAYPQAKHGMRAAQLRQFPYLAFFKFDDAAVTIEGVLHGRRDPDIVAKRLQDRP